MTTHRRTVRTPMHKAAIAAALCLAGVSSQAQAEDWDWMVAPYLWAATFSTDHERTVPPLGGNSNDTNYGNILDKLDGGFQIHAEGQGDQFGVFTDFTFLGLADEKSFERFDTQSDLDARLFELAAVWNPAPGSYQGFDVFAGLRYIDVDFTIEFDPVNAGFNNTTFDGSKSYSDFMLGARYTAALSERWHVTFRGDGSWGATEGSVNASAVLQYRMKRGAWVFGYRYLSVDFGDDDSQTALTLSGPQIGYAFAF